ncbi:succinylarginine dihydrolase [Candidatus Marinamargulisbacteria bacterium SCGC AAA071-K20]|nr:succinylarginine dihydrolase [Candidatus Marinamargulisbacteria bacterium SCGC AAA071-K20]
MIVFLDSLVGPSHHFGGIASGNLASKSNQYQSSNPRQAAIEGLEKMKVIDSLGFTQFLLPPQIRPQASFLKAIGLKGGFSEPQLNALFHRSPSQFSSLFSTAYMWMANAGIVSSAADTTDGNVHITPANLQTCFHRSLESKETSEHFKALFSKSTNVIVHAPVHSSFSDEGSANVIRLFGDVDGPGVNLFVYGNSASENSKTKFPARQSREALEVIERTHQLKHVVYARQHSRAIDAGVFHNDVIAMGVGRTIIVHENAYYNLDKVLDELNKKATAAFNKTLKIVVVTENELPLEDAIATYFFNSQLLQKKNGQIVMVAPEQCKKHKAAKKLMARLVKQKIISKIVTVPLGESMNNGGGPACLRLSMDLPQSVIKKIPKEYKFTIKRYDVLKEFIQTNYPDWIVLRHFNDAEFVHELLGIQASLCSVFK